MNQGRLSHAVEEGEVSGRAWRVVRQPSWYREPKVSYEGPETVARRRYEKIALNLRQGKVELFNPNGERVAVESGPMIRTRW